MSLISFPILRLNSNRGILLFRVIFNLLQEVTSFCCFCYCSCLFLSFILVFDLWICRLFVWLSSYFSTSTEIMGPSGDPSQWFQVKFSLVVLPPPSQSSSPTPPPPPPVLGLVMVLSNGCVPKRKWFALKTIKHSHATDERAVEWHTLDISLGRFGWVLLQFYAKQLHY